MTVVATHTGPITSRAWLVSHGVRIVMIIAIALLVSWMARFAVRRMQRRLEGATTVVRTLDAQRAATLTHALSYVFRITIWTLTLLLLLDQFDVNVAPLIAGAGIAGVALGFGAQAIVKDFLSGFFILLENQFAIGDLVELQTTGGEVSGRIEDLSLRITAVRGDDGAVHIVPNGNIQVVGNRRTQPPEEPKP